MDFQELIRKRRIVRNYRPDPVDPEALERILQAARRSPSAGFTQGQDLIVVTDGETRKAIGEICGERAHGGRFRINWVSNAPVQIVICSSQKAYLHRYSQPDKLLPDGSMVDFPVPWWYVDAGCMLMMILLAAVDEGLAAGFTGTRRIDDLRRLLGIPGDRLPIGIVTLGHPAEDLRSPSLRRGRKPVEEFIRRERW